MAESLGSVAVTITGDYAPLNAALAQAQAIAQRAGASIASAFSGQAAAAPGIVDQFGRAITSTASASTAAAPQIATLSRETIGLAASANEAAQALSRQAAAAHQGVTEIQATSGALRVLEGSGGIRAAERFLTMIPGLGAALQAAFPVIGAIALATAVFHIADGLSEVAEKWTLVGISEKFAKDAADDYAKSVDKIKDKMAALDQANFTKSVGRVGGAANDATALQNQAIAVQNQANALKGFRDQQQAVLEGANAAIKRSTETPGGGGVGQQAQLTALSREAAAAHAELDGLNKSIGEFENQADLLRKQSSAQAVTSLTGSKEESDTARVSAAALRTAQLRAADERAQRDAQSARQIVEIRAAEATQLAKIQIDAISGTEARQLAAAYAQVRIEQEKQKSLLQIAEAERDTRAPLARGIGAQESVGKDANERGAIAARVSDQVRAIQDAYSSALNTANAATSKARNQVTADIATWQRNLIDETTKGLEELQARLAARAEQITAARTRAGEIGAKSAGDTGALAVERAKLQYEEQYALVAVHTAQQQIQYAQTLAQIDATARQAKIEGLTNALNQVPDNGDPKNIVRTAELEAELAKAQADAKNANIVANTTIERQEQAITLQYKLRSTLRQAGESVPGALGGALASGLTGGGHGQNVGQQITNALKGVGQQLLGGVFTTVIHQLIASLLATTIAQHVMTAIFGVNTSVQAANTAATTALAAANVALVAGDTAIVTSNAALIVALADQTVATYAQIALLGFADGGTPPVGVPSIVGERGPEIFVPHQSGTVIPNHMVHKYADGAALSALPSAGGSMASVMHTAAFSGDMHIHIPAQGSPRQHAVAIFNELPKVAKSKSSAFSPYSR